LQNLALLRAKNANSFVEFFGKNIFKIITSVPERELHKPHFLAMLQFKNLRPLPRF
jgi:hypothetical protein